MPMKRTVFISALLCFVAILTVIPEVCCAAAEAVTGDINKDGVRNIADVTALLNCLENNNNASKEYDLNGDGKVNIADATALLNMLAFIEEGETAGLSFRLNADGASYSLAGLGDATDTDLKVPAYHLGMPVTAVDPYAFYGNSHLKSLRLPEGIRSIGAKAFCGCYNMVSVDFPNSLERIGSGAFGSCASLKELALPETLQLIEPDAFSGLAALEKIKVDGYSGKYYSMDQCLIRKGDKTLVLGCKNSQIPTSGSVTTIGKGAFDGCSGLTALSLPSRVNTIEEYAFRNCTGLSTATLNCAVTVLPDSAFEGCTALTQVTLPANLQQICKRAFRQCTVLQEIQIPQGVELIGESAFAYCSSLASLKLPAGMKQVEKELLAGCKALTSLQLPEKVSTVAEKAFYNCTALRSVSFGGAVTFIDQTALQLCTDLTYISVASENSRYYVKDGCLIDGSTKTLMKGTEGCQIPQDCGIAVIGSYALYGCGGISTLRLPVTLKEVGSYAFANCPQLKTVCFSGSKDQWNAVSLGFYWTSGSSFTLTFAG